MTMPSKKKKKKKSSRGNARKGNNRKKKEEPIDAQMERLKMNDDSNDEVALLEKSIKLATVEKEALDAAVGCSHGLLVVPSHDRFIIKDFADTFADGYKSVDAEANLEAPICAASKAVKEKYPEVWEDLAKLKLLASMFLFNGTQAVLEEDIGSARFFATSALFLRARIKRISSGGTSSSSSSLFGVIMKVVELTNADEHTLVHYLRKNIPCFCLNEKYKQVKSITKMGVCGHHACSVPGRTVERRSMLSCNGCRNANYCSRECQKAAWPNHKEECDEYVEARAGLDSTK
eukprot:scaffold2353_cov93-Skeletonema_dohrnii-CCMP3373.AAC.2